MAIRATMQSLISRTRLLVGDPAGGAQHFSDEAFQSALDASAVLVEAFPLDPIVNPFGSGYTRFVSPLSSWEDDPVLQNVNGQAVTPSEADLERGSFTFPVAQQSSVHITGRSYDPHAAAAQLLDAWAAELSGEFDFSTENDKFARSQQMGMKLAAAAAQRALARARMIPYR